MEKREKPDVDVFVMSHCPFGTQIEKGLLPVWDLFGDKINLNIRFVDYAMHGKKEIDEQLKQYCVGEQGKQKLRTYLECFLKSGEENNNCAKAAKVDSGALAACIKKSDKEFGVTKAFEDKSQWKGRFPPFTVHKELSQKYEVRGSPTLVINDVVVQAGRSPKAIQGAVCKGFKQAPEECKKELDASNPSPGFGSGKAPAGGGSGAACGG
jgi:protein-disulfide isomerase